MTAPFFVERTASTPDAPRRNSEAYLASLPVLFLLVYQYLRRGLVASRHRSRPLPIQTWTGTPRSFLGLVLCAGTDGAGSSPGARIDIGLYVCEARARGGGIRAYKIVGNERPKRLTRKRLESRTRLVRHNRYKERGKGHTDYPPWPSLHTPKAVTYHEEPHYCRFMIGHSLGRMDFAGTQRTCHTEAYQVGVHYV